MLSYTSACYLHVIYFNMETINHTLLQAILVVYFYIETNTCYVLQILRSLNQAPGHLAAALLQSVHDLRLELRAPAAAAAAALRAARRATLAPALAPAAGSSTVFRARG